MSAWVKQDSKQVKKHGKNKASWYCEWNEPDGTRRNKSCGPGRDGKRLANQLKDNISAQLKLGTYVSDKQKQKTWDQFVAEYLKHISNRAAKTVVESRVSLSHFRRILKLGSKPVGSLTTKHVDTFRDERRQERGKKPGSKLSPATINKDMRTVKAALNVAAEWGYLESVPKFKMEREPKYLPRYITPEHFLDLYRACEIATFPTELPYAPSEWWRALIMTLQMTGWRIGEVLALEWDDVNLDTGMAITRASDNKGKRDEIVRLHQTVLDHIEPLRTFHPNVFPWEHNRKTLDKEFHRIQNEAGIHLPCNIQRKHDCTPTCHLYGFHDERRAFATMNAMNMTREALQALMRHQSPMTTDRYINFAQQINPAVQSLYVPEVSKKELA